MENQITINITKENVTTTPKYPLTFEELLQITFSIQAHYLQAYLKKTPQAILPQIEEKLYSAYNLAASNILHKVFPNIEKNPDLTAQAILELEDQILNANKYKSRPPE